MRCKYCGNTWHQQSLELGSKCPTCGAVVEMVVSIARGAIDGKVEVIYYDDPMLRVSVFKGLRDEETVWTLEFQHRTYATDRELFGELSKLIEQFPDFSAPIQNIIELRRL